MMEKEPEKKEYCPIHGLMDWIPPLGWICFRCEYKPKDDKEELKELSRQLEEESEPINYTDEE
jgi:hypothetical protein